MEEVDDVMNEVVTPRACAVNRAKSLSLYTST